MEGLGGGGERKGVGVGKIWREEREKKWAEVEWQKKVQEK